MQVNNDAMTRALGAIRDATDVAGLRTEVMHALGLCGIDAAFFVAPLARDMRAGRLLTNMGFPRVWERHYRARLHFVDPLPTLSFDFSNAFFWPEDVHSGKLSKQERRYMEIASQYGLACGIGVACYGPHGRAGFLGTAWTGDIRPSDNILLTVHQIGQTSFQRYCQIMREHIDITPLSNRELEVLGWMCSGKSNPAMAEIIGVSRSSIDAYIRRIFAKLGTTDRTAACVRAYSLGLIASQEVVTLVEKARVRDEPRR
ncbi:hypothetical protein AAV99_00185 [Aurantiacibacter marinus]|uniref:HTH luxR-type domain-containing protein n=2 Tax=Aurantiacibacter marinus TaxID=874156 RepID=A0A0H0XNE4_9SPHN|nr:hypothetical protein AAV99_00185 [Aurantiacibacter marinus]